MKYILKILFVIISICVPAGLSFTGCSESDCPLQSRPMIKFVFYSKEQPTKPVQFNDTLSIITTNTIQGDSILVNKEKNASQILVPLSYVADETTYILKYTETMSDTIWVNHTNIEHFVSMDCGISVFSHIDNIRYTQYAIDSLAVRNSEIDNNEKENVQIFYPTVTDN